MSATARMPPAPEPGQDDDASVAGRRTRAGRAGAAVRRAAGHAAPPVALLMVMVGLWHVASTVLLDESRRFLLPPPHEVLTDAMLDRQTAGEILTALLSTTSVMAVGMFLSVTLGVAVAVLMAQARWVERSLFPYAVALQTVPVLALVPLIGFWFGFTFRSRVLVVVMVSIFPMITNTLFGLQSAERSWHDVFTLARAGRLVRLFKLEFPAATPSIFTGLRICAALSLIGAIVGDFFFRQGTPGIGRLLDVYRAQLDSPKLFAAIIFSTLLGLCVFWIFSALSELSTRSWRTSGRGR